MSMNDYLKLKNGSDVRGVACDGVEGENVTLTEEIVANIAKAFCVWLISHTGKTRVRVAVGYDSRITSPALCEAVANGIISTGHDALITGLSTTPSMFVLLQNQAWMKANYCHGSIMITASHLPFNRNGLKFFSHDGGLESADVGEILEMAATYRFAEPNTLGEKTEKSYLDEYANSLVEMVRSACESEQPLLGKKIIVDAGNGAGGFFADKVLVPLGADTTGSQFLEPDGTFPNHIPNPENADAMRSICAAVKNTKADFGIIFDTDVDRAGAVDENGEEINRNRLIALISAILLQEQPGSTIVTDSVTSDGLTKFIKAKGGKHLRFKRGYKNVINEAKRLNEQGEYAPLAIETSGHAALMENYFLDDGAYLITRLLIALAKAHKEAKSLTDLIYDLDMPVESVELRAKLPADSDFKALGKKVIDDFTAYASNLYYAAPASDNYEGMRLRYDELHGNGWALIRMSLHDPVLPINVESDSHNGCIKIVKDLYYFLRKYSFLNIEPLEQFIAKWRGVKREEVLDKLESYKQ
ncbi:MAG: phosphomannomutase/phosphoglucomutase [Clostridiales bacterium]|nr:phosphomannomutase/phosphoglucomutase [Clostridiales bacterium]